MSKIFVCKTKELSLDGGITIDMEDRTIALFSLDGKIYAIDDFCRHRGGHLGEGTLREEIVACPLHGWRYNITNGECLSHPKGDVQSYPVIVENENVYLLLKEII